MFERFTEKARRVVVLAQEEARTWNHAYIGTEHLLLGLLSEAEGLACKVLQASGFDLESTRRLVEERVGPGGSRPQGHIPFTPRAKKVLEFSLREALRLGHNYIGTEHILLGLVTEGEGVGAQVLMTKVEGGLEAVRRSILEGMAGSGEIPADPGVAGALGELRHERLEQELLRVNVSGELKEHLDAFAARLEAIEVRLSAIEGILRNRDAGTEAS